MDAVAREKSSAGSTLMVSTPSDREILMTRVFNAPRRLVFQAWTTPELFSRWFGPRGFTVPVCEMDLRPGGAWRCIMRSPDGVEMGMKGVYQEIVPYERLVSTEIYDDYEEYGASLNTLTLEEKDGVTTLTTRVLYPSMETRDAVIASGMEGGASQTLDRLEELLATM